MREDEEGTGEEIFAAGAAGAAAGPGAVERFAVAQAMYKAVAGAVKTRTPGNLRAAFDEEVRRLWEEGGASTVEVRLRGTKVGTASVTAEDVWTCTDEAAFMAWAEAQGHVRRSRRVDPSRLSPERAALLLGFCEAVYPDAVAVEESLDPAWSEGLAWDAGSGSAVTPDGEAVPGVGRETRFKTTVRGCEPEAVAAALGDGCGPAVAGVLEGGAR
jgi:hypothetical protein